MKNATNKNSSPPQPPSEAKKRDDHLGYLLTAYVFENLSAAGKAEVESHLKTCAECRAQLELLRLTLGLAEEALQDEPGKTYVFEDRRRQRVLEAAQRSRHSFLHRLDRPAFSFRDWRGAAIAAVAALFALALVIPLFITAGGTRSMSRARVDTATIISSSDEARTAAVAQRRSTNVDFDNNQDGLSGGKPGIDLAGGTELRYEEPAANFKRSEEAFGFATLEKKNPVVDRPTAGKLEAEIESLREALKPAQPKDGDTILSSDGITLSGGVSIGTRNKSKKDEPAATAPAKPAAAASLYVKPPESNAPAKPSEPQNGFSIRDEDMILPKTTQKIEVDGGVAISGDVLIKGYVQSDGLQANGNVFVPGELGEQPNDRFYRDGAARPTTPPAVTAAPTRAPSTPPAQDTRTEGVALNGKAASAGQGETWAAKADNKPALGTELTANFTASTAVAEQKLSEPMAACQPQTFRFTGKEPVTTLGGEPETNFGGFNYETTETLKRRNTEMEAEVRRQQKPQSAPVSLSATADPLKAPSAYGLFPTGGAPGATTAPASGGGSAGGLSAGRGGTVAEPRSDRKEDVSKLSLDFNASRDRELNRATELSTVKNARDMKPAEIRDVATPVENSFDFQLGVMGIKDQEKTVRGFRESTGKPSGPDTISGRDLAGVEAKAKAEDTLQQLTQEMKSLDGKSVATKDETTWSFAKEKRGQQGLDDPIAEGATKIPVQRLKNLNYFGGDVRITPEPETPPVQAADGTTKALKDEATESKTRNKIALGKADSQRGERAVAGRYVQPAQKPADPALDAEVEKIKEALPRLEVMREQLSRQSVDPSSAEGRLAVQADQLKDEIDELRVLDRQQRGLSISLQQDAMKSLEEAKSPEQLQEEVAQSSQELAELKKKIVRQSRQSALQNQLDNGRVHEETEERAKQSQELAAAEEVELTKLGDVEFFDVHQPATVRFGEEKPVQLSRLAEAQKNQQGLNGENFYGWNEADGKKIDVGTTELLAKRGKEDATNIEGSLYHRGRIEQEYDKNEITYGRRERETEQFKARVGKMLGQVEELNQRGDHKSAEKMAAQILKIDPLNETAEGLKNKSRGLQHQGERAELTESRTQAYKEAMLHVDEASISNGPLIVYPSNWDQISKRSDSAALGVAASNEEPWKKEVRKKLQGKVSFEYDGKPLEEVVKDLNEKTNAGIVLDPKVLESKGKTPISLRVTDMSADLALDWVTRLAELEYNLRDEKAVVGQPTSLASSAELNILDVRDLTSTVQDFPGPRIDIPVTLLRPKLDPNFTSRVDANNSAQPAITAESLVAHVKAKFADDFTDPSTAIEESGGKLVVMASPETQKRISEYIGELRNQYSQTNTANAFAKQKAFETSGFDDAAHILKSLTDRDLDKNAAAAGEPNAPAGFRRQFYSQPFGSPTLVQGQQLNLLRLNPLGSALGASIVNSGGPNDERTLRAFNYLREQSKDSGSVTLPDFLKRPAPIPAPVLSDEGLDEDAYIEKYGTRPFVDARRDKLSTFGMDVDTASYTLARSRLNADQLPDPTTVRVEEFVNYFKQPYTVEGEEAFAVFAEAAPSPFQRAISPFAANYVELTAQQPLQVLKIGIKSRDPKEGERKPAQLTFAIDTSGSMTKDDRLTLVRGALKNLVDGLKPEDSLAIVTFSDQAQVALPRTQARQKQRIIDAIDALHSNGGTSVEAGLNLAYRLADESFAADAVNRVILCSDGVANIGAEGPAAMLKTVKVFADRGIDLAAVGFGNGQYNDEMLVKLADSGNGSCHFVDSAAEAKRVFSEQLPPNLSALARDAKVQVEFNPETVAKYRLLGYEKRKIADKDFRNDKIDAGEVQHSTLVTALYEIERVPAARGTLGKVFLRWKDAGHRHLPVVERNFPLDENIQSSSVESAPAQLRFLACVARFAELLRESKWVKNSSYADVLDQLHALPAETKQREDFKEVLTLVQKAQKLSIAKWTKTLSP